MANRKNTEAQFWEKVVKTNGCWNFTGYLDKGGYGRFSLNGENTASRVSWQLAHGKIPFGTFVLHRCDNAACVKPEHLYLGDNRQNVLDRTTRKRHWKDRNYQAFSENLRRVSFRGGMPGEQNGRAKLTVAQVQEIRERFANGDVFQKDLARHYGVCKQTICNIVHGKRWLMA